MQWHEDEQEAESKPPYLNVKENAKAVEASKARSLHNYPTTYHSLLQAPRLRRIL
jgi:hypothetical protein